MEKKIFGEINYTHTSFLPTFITLLKRCLTTDQINFGCRKKQENQKFPI